MPKASADQAALLRAVCDRPDDDLVRLVYADWLEENGRADRARFIRLQIEEAAADPTAERGPVEWERRNAMDLLAHLHAKDWLKELPKWVQKTVFQEGMPLYRRGFVERLVVTTSPFLTFGGQMIHSYPVRDLRFMEVGRQMGRLVALPWISRLREVSFAWEPLSEEAVRHLARSEYLNGPTVLDLRYCGLTDAELRGLATAPWIGQLTTLRLSYNPITWNGLGALVSSRHFIPTVRIELNNQGLLEDARQLLAGRAVWVSPSPPT